MADNIQPVPATAPGVGPTALRAQTPQVTSPSIPTADSNAANPSDADKIKTADEYTTDFGSGEEVSRDDSTKGALALLLTYAVRHNGDAQFSQAAAKFLAKLSAEAGVPHNVAHIRMPPHDVQQNIGHGQFTAVEKVPESPDDAAKRIVPLNATQNTPQVPGVDPLGHKGIVGDAKPVNEVSTDPTSLPTMKDILPSDSDAKKNEDAKKADAKK